jgi:hypothetical protein
MKRNVRRFKTLNYQLAGGDVEEIERNILRNARAREANGFDDDSGSADVAGNSDSSSDSTEPEDENYQRFYEEEEGDSEPNRRQDKRGGDRRIQRRPIDFDDKKHAEAVANRLQKRVGDARVLGTHDQPAGIKGWPPVDWDNDNELYARPVRPPTGTQRRKQHQEGEQSALPKSLEERRVQHEGHREATLRKSGTQKPMATVKPKITDQMKTTARILGTHDQQAGIKGWPPVDWDMRSSQYYHSWIHLDGRVKYVSLEATHQKHPQRQPPTSNNTMVDSKISESAFQI